jgi:glycosyltransferase involved in cell wall biosynthesis
MPTRADCTPLVVLEANAFALPSLATNVGGIPEIIKHGINGATFAITAEPIEYCDFIVNNHDKYEELSLGAFAQFQDRLNNNSAASSVLSMMEELL